MAAYGVPSYPRLIIHYYQKLRTGHWLHVYHACPRHHKTQNTIPKDLDGLENRPNLTKGDVN